MLREELGKIARQSGNSHLVVSYAGADHYAAGMSDGAAPPLTVNGTLTALQTARAEKLPSYLTTGKAEAEKRKAADEQTRKEAELKKAAASRKTADEARAAQQELTLFNP